jgi:predicted secreted protein
MVELIRVEEGATFEIRLTGHATAGYLWRYDLTEESRTHVALVKPPSWGPNPTGVGGSAVQTFVFRALQQGTVTLRFTLTHGFAKGQREGESRQYEIRIDAVGGEMTTG